MSRRRVAAGFFALGLCLLLLAGGCGQPPATTSKPATIDGIGQRMKTPRRTGRSGTPHIRVLLIEGATRFSVAVNGPYQIRRNNQTLATGPNLRRIPVTVLEGRPPRLLIGQLACSPGDIEIIAGKPGTLRVFFERGEKESFSRRYHGTLRMHANAYQSSRSSLGTTPGRGTIDVINVVDLERYLPSVLEAELYPNWRLETFRAQAIAARTYALYSMQTTGTRQDFDVRATESSQVYKGLDGMSKSSKAPKATRDTQGIVCTWASPLGEKIFCTYFSSACGGMTQDASNCLNTPSIRPLAGGVKCTYCNIGGRVYRWKPVRISKDAVSKLFYDRFPQHAKLGKIKTITAVKSTSDGRPLTLKIVGENGRRLTFDSYAFRLAMGGHRILSNHCKIVDHGDMFEFRDGRGFGHAVGLCQWGAEGQARLGKKASEILAFYYPGSHLKKAY